MVLSEKAVSALFNLLPADIWWYPRSREVAFGTIQNVSTDDLLKAGAFTLSERENLIEVADGWRGWWLWKQEGKKVVRKKTLTISSGCTVKRCCSLPKDCGEEEWSRVVCSVSFDVRVENGPEGYGAYLNNIVAKVQDHEGTWCLTFRHVSSELLAKLKIKLGLVLKLVKIQWGSDVVVVTPDELEEIQRKGVSIIAQ